jgi:general secretion pathway protein F
MPQFRYKAVNRSGEIVEDVAEAASSEEVVQQLHTTGLIPIRVAAGSAARRSLSSWLGDQHTGRVGARVLGELMHELSELARVGMPLDRALASLSDVHDEPEAQRVLTQLREAVRGGASLSKAMQAHPGVFSPLAVGMVTAGEASGRLDEVLASLAGYLERSRALREQILSAMIYPAILVGVSILSIVILLIFVIPHFAQILEDAGQPLPLPTQIVVGAGALLNEYWWLMLSVVLAGLLVLRRQLHNPRLRTAFDRWALSVPLLGELIVKTNVARLSYTLGMLLKSGVPLLRALTLAADTITNRVMADEINRVHDQVRGGRKLARSLAESELFPRLATHMLRVGEESGALESALLQIAKTYERETQASIRRTLTLLEPALILGLGMMVAGIIMSILIAILDMNQLVM